jgi:hypothetical protein
MKYKFTSNSNAYIIFNSTSDFAVKQKAKIKGELYSNTYFDELNKQSIAVRKLVETLPTKLKGPPITTNNELWDKIKYKFIDYAFKYRLENDILFRNILISLRNAKYVLTYEIRANNILRNIVDTSNSTVQEYIGKKIEKLTDEKIKKISALVSKK